MGIQPVGYRPAQIAAPKRIQDRKAGLAIAAGTEVILSSLLLPSVGHPVLESLYYDGSAGGNGFLHFRVTLDGSVLPDSFADSYNPIGAPGNPAIVGKELPPGRTLEIRCKNEHASTVFDAFCDGEVFFYADQPR